MINSRNIDELHPTLQRGARELIRRMTEKGYKVGISSTYRDNESQDALYAQGRTKPGKIVTNAKGGQSIHNYRLAFDVFQNIVGQEYSDDRFFDVAGQICEDMGGEWGGSWKSFIDDPHMQYTDGLTLAQLQAGAALPQDSKMLWELTADITTLDEALDRLDSYNVIDTPLYWENLCKYIYYLDQLIINASNAVAADNSGRYTDANEALAAITDSGAILSPEYWSALIGKVRYLPDLLIKIANHLG